VVGRHPVTRGIGGRAVVVVISVALLAGCGGDQASDATPSPTTFTASPLGSAYSLLALGQAEQAQIHAEAERLIAACMKDQGFAYDQVHVPDRLVLDPETDPADHAAQFGYGVVDSARTLVADDQDATRSAAEQAAYDRALYGDGADHADEDGAVAYDWRTQGCLGSAYHQATDGADELMADPRFAALFAALAQVEAEVDESAEVADLARAWAACMADAGHPDLGVPEDAVLSIRQGLVDVSGQVADSALDRELDELRLREIDTALADLACQGSTEYASRFDQILWAAHAELAEEFGPELAALTEAEVSRPRSEG